MATGTHEEGAGITSTTQTAFELLRNARIEAEDAYTRAVTDSSITRSESWATYGEAQDSAMASWQEHLRNLWSIL